MIGFLDLPGEIRNLIYEHLLVFDEPIVPWAKEQVLPVNLLYTNKTVHHEFGSLLYSRITFDFSSQGCDGEKHQCPACSARMMNEFLDQIGQNAKNIRSIKIDFPHILRQEEESLDVIYFAEHSIQIVSKIADCCPGLRELILGPHVTMNILLDFAVLEPDEADVLMSRVHDLLMEIPSLDTISVLIPDCDEFYDLMDDMVVNLGWQVELISPCDFDWMWDDEDEDEDADDDDDEDEDDDQIEDEGVDHNENEPTDNVEGQSMATETMLSSIDLMETLFPSETYNT